MKLPWLSWSAVFLVFGSAPMAEALACPQAFERTLPFDLPLGQDQAYVNIHSELRFGYDCTQATGEAQASARAGVFDIDLQILEGSVLAQASLNRPVYAEAQLLVLGYEVARETLEVGTLLDINLSPEPDLDINKLTTFNVGPLPIPVQYGVLANAQLGIRGGLAGLGAQIELNPAVQADVYLQAGVDLKVAQIVARGEVLLLNDTLFNQLSIGFVEDEQLQLRLSGQGENQLEALRGDVFMRAQIGTGESKQEIARELLQWDGFNRQDRIYQFSETIAVLDQ